MGLQHHVCDQTQAVFYPIRLMLISTRAERGLKSLASCSIGEPIRNPLTGAEHRVGIDFPRSFEGSGTSKTSGSLRIPI